MPDEKMDIDGILDGLNGAIAGQNRSALQYTLVAGSLTGFQYQGVATQLWSFAAAELDDTRRLVEKVVALGGQPSAEVPPLRSTADPSEATGFLIETETEIIEGLKETISATGQEGASEALEHLIEHVIMRKQSQVDFLVRARGIS